MKSFEYTWKQNEDGTLENHIVIDGVEEDLTKVAALTIEVSGRTKNVPSVRTENVLTMGR